PFQPRASCSSYLSPFVPPVPPGAARQKLSDDCLRGKPSNDGPPFRQASYRPSNGRTPVLLIGTKPAQRRKNQLRSPPELRLPTSPFRLPLIGLCWCPLLPP